MSANFSSLEVTLIVGIILLVSHIFYRAALPRPLVGIPYNRDAAGKFFGDVPEMMGYVLRTRRIFVGVGCSLLDGQSRLDVA